MSNGSRATPVEISGGSDSRDIRTVRVAHRMLVIERIKIRYLWRVTTGAVETSNFNRVHNTLLQHSVHTESCGWWFIYLPILIFYMTDCGQGSSVGIATELWTGRSGIESRWG